MRQEQNMQLHQKYAMRLWLFISKPFQISKVLEILYMLDWIWYAILSLLPAYQVGGTLFSDAREITTPFIISVVIMSFALSHVVGLLKNVVWLRKLNLLINTLILSYLASNLFTQTPFPSGVGYFLILIGVTIFAYLRMDENM